MSKLSEYAAKKGGMRFADLEAYNKKQIIEKLYDRISNLDFKAYEYDKKKFVLEIGDFLVKITGARTSGFGIYYAGEINSPNMILSKVEDEKDWCYVNEINKDNEYIDIKDLLIYCENESTPLKLSKTKQLNSEIDNGFRKQDVIFGRDTLEEDVKFNEWLHRKMK